MASTGPAPKSSALRDLEGLPGSKKLNANEPQPIQEIWPEAPDWLTEDELKIWNILSLDLIPLKLLTRIDKNTFARYCSYLNKYITLKFFVDKHGSTYPVYEDIEVRDESGGRIFEKGMNVPKMKQRLKLMRQFPQFKQMLELGAALHTLECEFGLTPSARSRISIGSDGKVGGDKQKAARGFEYLARRRSSEEQAA